MFFTLSNDVTINIYQISAITKPIQKDPYSKSYGKQFEIIMSSGHKYTCFDSISNASVPTFGNAVLNYQDFIDSLKCFNQNKVFEMRSSKPTDVR